MKRFLKFLFVALLLLAITPAFAQLSQKLEKFDNISGIQELQIDQKMENPFQEKYVMFFEQPIDHKNPSLGTYKQRVIVALADYNAPTVLVTEGYGAAYALNPLYRDEISRLFNTNLVVVEHRYFLESVPFMQEDSTITPSTLDWSYMTGENNSADIHNINQTLREVFKGKWIATGISKGGQNSLIYTSFYPEDVDITVPYVGPLCKGVEDGRHEPFLEKVTGSQADRDVLRAFQNEFLDRRATIKPIFDSLCNAKGYKFSAPLDAIYDYTVLEFPFAFWQWGRDIETVPGKDATDKEMLNYLLMVSGPDYFAHGDANSPFFVQAAKELGYYGYDTKPFKGKLSIKSAKGYLHQLFLPEGVKVKFSKKLYRKVNKFYRTTKDSKILAIYGEYDPWSAVRVPDSDRENVKVFIDPEGSHRARIGTLPEEMKEEVMETLKSWLAE